jgi:hypothetical protein
MKKSALFVILVVFLSSAPLFADGGSIPFKRNVTVFEPNQRAMIAWNGSDEILLLSMDLKASEATKVLEVLPLPSEPVVKKGDVETFRRATALINQKIRRPNTGRRRGGGRGGGGGSARPAGEVTFHQKIGAQDIHVTHVLDTGGFIDWVEKYLQSAGVENPDIPAGIKKAVGQYLEEGFTWFVFYVVSLDEALKTGEAIQYKFKTKFLYYPMKVTQTATGRTTIDLLVLSPRLLEKFPGIPSHEVQLRHEPVSITSRELRGLNPDMDTLLGHREDMKLRIWRIQGQASSFRQDLIAH